uniref:Uncharacterized protein n=1 Tax=Aegilops tauschii subsp. strangulata TaxID=200361 RepID=A0A453EXI5_AEGTS
MDGSLGVGICVPIRRCFSDTPCWIVCSSADSKALFRRFRLGVGDLLCCLRSLRPVYIWLDNFRLLYLNS